jgi:hypothetical protein
MMVCEVNVGGAYEMQRKDTTKNGRAVEVISGEEDMT